MDSEEPIIATDRTFLINSILSLFLLSSIPLLFTGNFDLYQHRLSPFIWNTGHIFVFFALIWLTVNLCKPLSKPGFLGLFMIVNITILLLGLGIEEIQSRLGRQSSIDDVYKNCLGASLAILFHPGVPSITPSLRAILRIFAILLVIVALYPLTINTLDWIYARTNFPVLSNFETPFETERWTGQNMLVLNSDSYSLQHEFDDAMYSSVSLIHFPGNWEGYYCFSFRIFNAGSNEVPLRIRINDRQHDETGQSYFDRFNHSLDVLPGWNNFVIDLSDIKNAPRNRSMDMGKVEKIGFFTSHLRNGAILNFDDLELIDRQPQCHKLQHP
jgi:VanZ family protein